ncbi:unnamed protein product [Rotaria socialis]|uniref:Peptidase M60 domain-containing protein n=1 Tax=Rotaria socialis TaxID=392032 RepID=A0A817XH69_9BILA|nr:unnamed protein product [Rotaria socialis]CAF3464678.1 unnamed protein product [Rotaria socialis]CAF4323317.1 unnamed protein product [Rotaria socialis]CAF4524651.1 unnamed protein product [Rotaria socialis]
MDDTEFDQAPQLLFEGVSSIEKIGCPGTLIPLTNDTRAVLCGDDSNNVIIVATRFGLGRCLVFAHNGYPGIFFNTESKYQQFVENCRRWLARGHQAEFLSIDKATSMNDISAHGKILVWNGHREKSEAFMNNICEFLERGGALICGSTAWGWLQGSGKLLSDFPFARFCDYIGVKITDNYANCPNPIEFREGLIEFKNIYHAVRGLANNPSNITTLSIVGSAIKELGDTLPGVSIETLENIVMNAGEEVIPMNQCPVKDKLNREQSAGICGIMCALPGIKAPGVRHFPGDFDRPPNILTGVRCHFKSIDSEWHCSGYYVAAGIPIQIDVLEQKGAPGWSARVGCHSDDLGGCDEYRRWPCISIRKPLVNNSVNINSAFGGLLFFQSPEGGPSSITVTFHHVVLAPTYDVTELNHAALWEYRRSRAQGLWADIAGRHIVFNLPCKSVVHLKSTELHEVLEFWDAIILAHHDLRGTKPTRRERVVCDEQPSLGYMHSGYPVVTHMDVSDPNSDGFLLDCEKLKQKGAWGLFHELGHNMQQGWWTFDGTGEVTVNIFTLHAMDKVCHLETWIHPWLQDQISSTQKYIEKGCNFDEWKNKPGVALFIYAQLIREYGWQSYKDVFREYEQTKPNLHSDQEKMDHWIITFSKQVGYNLVPLFKFWGFPISESTVDNLKQLTVPQIFDDFIQMAPERYCI